MVTLVKIIDTGISGLKVLESRVFEDSRGKFIKTFNNAFFLEYGLDIQIEESYYSISHKGVIRGMHFQVPPYAHLKLVYVPYGKIIDVVLDIRKSSPTYGDYFDIELSSSNAKVLIIPKGLAHGFKSLKDNTNVTYMQTSGYAPESDAGINFDSFGYDWKTIDAKISERDLGFDNFNVFSTPFVYD